VTSKYRFLPNIDKLYVQIITINLIHSCAKKNETN
jgi:hypothetical protein